MALNIPVEIWLLIASYVGKEDYDKLINVNSVFFNMFMDNRYREVTIRNIDIDDLTRRKLVRLCDPVVASRIRRLRIDPRFDWNKTKRDHWGFFKRLKFLRKDSAHILFVTQPPLQSLLVAVKCMSNVTELAVYWPGPAATEWKPLLPTAWNSFGQSLRSLTLGRTFPSVEKLVLSLTAAMPETCLVALEELCLEFGHDKYDSMQDSTRTMDAIDMGRNVTPLINKLSPQLRHLSISSRSRVLDLRPLFTALVPSFPALHHFSIQAPFRQTCYSNPNTLANFLRHNSKTIRSADLVFLPTISDLDDEVLARWLEELSSDPVVLPGLHSLKIYPTHSSQAGFDALVSLIRRSAETLTSLSISARFLRHEEVTAIVSIFSANHSTDSCNLVTLRLNLRKIDPPLIRLLATNLPGLKVLSLRLVYLRHRLQETYDITASNMQGHFYPEWGLHDLGIWVKCGILHESVLRPITKAVPSIKSFKCDFSW